MLKILKIQKNSPLKAYGIEKGDEILAFDNYPAEDELDLMFYEQKAEFTLTVSDSRTGQATDLKIEKDAEEELGIVVQKNEKIRTCQNRCIFCFVDQMPKGMRQSLYVKDDDYSMSFACGNFVTLTNLSDEGLDRIIRLSLSPLYISVHTMNPELRVELLRNKNAGKIVGQIQRLYEGNIKMHCQAVIVPNQNDGDELVYTAKELFKYYPVVKDLAVVPTGLTKYRDGLYKIDDVDKEYSRAFLELCDKLNEEFGVPFVLPADEYFIKAEIPLKDKSFYGDFEQIENGIGMTTKFLFEAETAISELSPCTLKKPKKSLVISGVSAKKINDEVLSAVNKKVENLTAETLPIVNRFFGESVTCTGLLTGVDILNALETYREKNGTFDEVILPKNTMKEFEDVFLCGMTLKELKKKLHFGNIRVNADGGAGLVRILSERKERE